MGETAQLGVTACYWVGKIQPVAACLLPLNYVKTRHPSSSWLSAARTKAQRGCCWWITELRSAIHFPNEH